MATPMRRMAVNTQGLSTQGQGAVADPPAPPKPVTSAAPVAMGAGGQVAPVIDSTGDFGLLSDLLPRVQAPEPTPLPVRPAGKPKKAPGLATGPTREPKPDPVELAEKARAVSIGGPGTTLSPDLARRVLDAAYEMSVVQAMNPSFRDETGFSNADYAFGGVLALAGDAQSSALLLSLYPRQAEARGLAQSDLLEAMPPELRNYPARSAAISMLRESRSGLRGAACWARMDDGHVFLMTYAQDWADTLPLRRNGVRTTTGFIVPMENLSRLLEAYQGTMVNRSGLEDLAAEARLKGVMALAEGRPAAALAVTATKTLDGNYLVGWTNPFDKEGVALREVVRDGLGGEFQAATKNWLISGRAAKLLPLAAASVDADFTDYPFHAGDLRGQDLIVAENLRNGVTTLEVLRHDDQGVTFSFLGKNPGAHAAILERGANHTKGFYRIPSESAVDLVANLDGAGGVDSSAVLDAAADALKAKAKTIAKVIAINEDPNRAIPDTTPTGIAYKPHQKEAYRFLWSLPVDGGILADDMGLGKTLEGLSYAYDRFHGGRKLVVPPTSLKRNWEKEIIKFFGKEQAAKTQVIRKGSDAIKPGTEWLIVNYDLLTRKKEELTAWKPDLLLLDEAHKIKGCRAEAGWSKALLGYTIKPKVEGERPQYVPGIMAACGKRLCLTGTAIENRVEELWNYLLLCIGDERQVGLFLELDMPIPGDPVSRELNFMGFAKRYCAAHQEQVSPTKWVWVTNGASNLDDLGRRLAPIYLRRLKMDVLTDFMGKAPQQSIPVELSAAEMKTYDAAVAKLLGNVEALLGMEISPETQDFLDRMIRDNEKVSDGALAECSALRQVTALMKIPAAIDYIQGRLDGGKKIIVFSNYLAVLNALQAEFTKPGADGEPPAFKVVRVDGSLNGDRRQKMVDQFQDDPNTMIILAQTKVGGVGYTMTASSEVLTVDRPWTPGAEDQCEDRANRIGQTELVNCGYLDAEGTFDDDLREILRVKREIIEAFEKGAASAPRTTDVDTIKELLLRVKESHLRTTQAKKGRK